MIGGFSRPRAMNTSASDIELIGVLDMGASAIRLVVAELDAKRTVRVIEEGSRGVLLGRDTFSTGAISSQTADAALEALAGFRRTMESYGVQQVRAVATSGVREARNADMFLDRVQGRTGIRFEVINEAEESRLTYLAVRHSLRPHVAFKGTRTLLIEVGGGSTSLTVLRRGQPTWSGVYALGSVRLRQQLDLRRHSHDLQVALLRRYISNVVEEIRLEVPLDRITHMIAMGGDVRFAASQIDDSHSGEGREVTRERFVSFCEELERLDEDAIVDRFRLTETAAKTLVVSEASLRAGLLLDVAEPKTRGAIADFDRQVLTSAETLGHRYRFDHEHGRHVAMLATGLFDQLADEHGLGDRERLLLQVAALLHDIGIFVSLRAHHKHSQYILATSQIFGLSNEETAVVANIARYHRRALPQNSHLPFIALDRTDRLTVSKLAAILRVANALDAEHAQKIQRTHLVRGRSTWTLELDGTGDLTMEQLAATARADMFAATYGHEILIRRSGVLP